MNTWNKQKPKSTADPGIPPPYPEEHRMEIWQRYAQPALLIKASKGLA